jgi:hypothetical protein
MDAQWDALDRALDLAWACPLSTSPGGIVMLARTLDLAAADLGCAPGEVPLDVLGYHVLYGRRAWAELGLYDSPGFVRDGGGPHDQMREAAEPVTHGWLVQVGRLRLGDHVIVTPEALTRPRPPWRGVIVGAWFDNPDHHGGINVGKLGPDPSQVEVRCDAPGDSERHVIPEDPWGVLLDESRHPDEDERAAAIRAWTATRDLRHAGSLTVMQGPALTRSYLQRRAQFYPEEIAAIFRDAAARPTLDRDEITTIALRLP